MLFSILSFFEKVHEYYSGSILPEEKYLFNTLKETFNVDISFHQDFIEIYKENLSYLSKIHANIDNQGKVPTRADVTSPSSSVETKSSVINKTSLFVIMPFSEKTNAFPKGYFDEVFSSLIVPAAADAGFTAVTAKRSGSDIIHSTIISDIYNAHIILADLTEHNPNVLFELGLAFAFKKKVAIIRSKGTAPIFDVDNLMRVYDYDSNLWKSTVERDVPNLSKHIQSTLDTDGSMYLDIFLKK